MIINFLINSIISKTKLDENVINKPKMIAELILDDSKLIDMENDFKNEHTDPNYKYTNTRPFDIPYDEYSGGGKYELKFMQVITRHGRRTPESKNYPLSMWTCNSFDELLTNKDKEKSGTRPTCFDGQLTIFGSVDLINVGKAYKHLLIDHLGFLDEKYNKNQIFIRSTDIERTINSARSLMHGLYEGIDDKENSPIHKSFYIKKERDENMYPRSSPKYNYLKSLLKNHNVIIKEREKSGFDKFTKQVQKIFEDSKFETAFYVPSWNTYAGLVNSFDCFRNNGLPIPKGFTNEIIDRMYLEASKEYKALRLFPELSILGIGRFVNDLTNQLILKSNNDPSIEQLKFALYSGHDSTLGALLVAFDAYEDNKHPVTSSALEFLLFQDKDNKSNTNTTNTTNTNTNNNKDHQYVKLMYNHKLAHIGKCKDKEVDNMCPLSEFLKIAQSIIPQNYEEQSKITDAEKIMYKNQSLKSLN